MAKHDLDILHTLVKHIEKNGIVCPHCNTIFSTSPILKCCPCCLIEYEYTSGVDGVLGLLFTYNESSSIRILYKTTVVNWSHR